ncbi:hemolysin family protein [Echinicola jeungdonensis]|uniref:Hemolysin family protein n=1 Tax=Echinicola jeungdonensis TaxID=709343 RepID=A0ABV5J910_9BACT|nr:hemolysin family protein [Echinicola jeungdonensis]MDN3669405.1 hemolysin family protein [Echinicola jeungdonensis]
MLLLVTYLLLAIGVSFLCSALEAALLSITPSYIVIQVEKGKTYAKSLKYLKENIDQPLAAILSLNTIAHTVGAAGVGAQAVEVFGQQYFGWISAGLTIAILVFSEIIPKSLGANFWRQLAPYIGGVLRAMIYGFYPLVKVSEVITQVFNNKEEQTTTSREDVAALTHIAAKEGAFEEGESKIIHNLIRFKSILVVNVMTPRTVTVALDEDSTVKAFFARKDLRRFSRFPVYKGSIDNITGYVLKYDVLQKLAEDQFQLNLKELKRNINIVYEHYPIPSVLELLLDKREHIALVVDKYGGMSGIVTMEDILETLLGLEIQDESDEDRDMQQLARSKWEERAKKMGLIFKQPGENID